MESNPGSLGRFQQNARFSRESESARSSSGWGRRYGGVRTLSRGAAWLRSVLKNQRGKIYPKLTAGLSLVALFGGRGIDHGKL
jgi:hypothetical protein